VIIYVEHLGARIVDSIWQARKEDTGSDGLILLTDQATMPASNVVASLEPGLSEQAYEELRLLMQLLKRGKLQYDRQLGG
jgi:hypothetical protein